MYFTLSQNDAIHTDKKNERKTEGYKKNQNPISLEFYNLLIFSTMYIRP